MVVGNRADERVERDYWEGRGLVWLWLAALAGPTAHFIDVHFGYASIKWACSSGHTTVLTLIGLVALAMACGGLALAWACLKRTRDEATDTGGTHVDRSYFMASGALGLNVMFVLLILTQAMPQLFVSPCE